MKNLINRALAAEKRLLILMVVAVMAAGVMAENKLPRTYCGCTLGQTVYDSIASLSSKLPESMKIPWGLAMSNEKCVFVGDFVVEDHHFSILSMSFYKDTLYKMEFRDEEINNNIMELNRAFIKDYKTKYGSFEKWLNSEDEDNEEIVSCTKKDSELGITLLGSKTSLKMSISYERLADESLQSAIGSLLSSSKLGANYDEKNKVTSIAGVRFGETRTNTINAFKQRGTFVNNENNITYFSDVKFGGSTYNLAALYFQYDSRRKDMVLASAKFEKNFYEWKKEEALMMYEAIVSNFKAKYTNCTDLEGNGDEKAMVCGMLEEGYADGKMPPILVTLELGISRGGEKFYYVTVSYFMKRMSSAANDDI